MANRQVVQLLETILADTYSLYMKTQSYHWNVEGGNFYSLHEAFEQQYEELASKVDVVAERIRMLQEKVLATFEEFSSLTSITKANPHFSSKDMMEDLVEGHEHMSKSLTKAIKTCEEESDFVSSDILTDQLAYHQKVLWMLKSTLAQEN